MSKAQRRKKREKKKDEKILKQTPVLKEGKVYPIFFKEDRLYIDINNTLVSASDVGL